MPHIDLDVRALAPDTPVRIENGAAGIVVVRTVRGVVAYEDVCPHAGWRLSQGEVIDGRLECPGHGWEFALDSGACASVPGYCLRRIDVMPLDGGFVRIRWHEQPAAAAVAADAM
ncbi:MAG TPA: Rieske 2Fe-2S domain-containing protein [Vicinamibacterales bacterium]|nr:Rieske 2Fe-2S domain-containing protein [Vicinamibacterales bacterium]